MAAPSQDQLRQLLNYFNTTGNGAPSDALLQTARYYDPGASVVASGSSDSGDPQYSLQLDYSKLPGFTQGTSGLGPVSTHGTTGESYSPGYQTVNPGTLLKNPGDVLTGTPYGTVTPNSNIKQPFDPMTILGPLATLALPFAFPALASALSGGALGGAGAGAAAGGAGSGSGSGLLFDSGTPAPIVDGGAGLPGIASGYVPGSAAATGTAAGTVLTPEESQAVMDWVGGPTGSAQILENAATLAGGAPAVFAGASGGLSLANVARGIANAARGITGANSLLNGGGAGAGGGGGGGLLSLGGGGSSSVPDSMAMLRAFYAPKVRAHMSPMGVADNPLAAMLQQPGGLQGLLGGMYG